MTKNYRKVKKLFRSSPIVKFLIKKKSVCGSTVCEWAHKVFIQNQLYFKFNAHIPSTGETSGRSEDVVTLFDSANGTFDLKSFYLSDNAQRKKIANFWGKKNRLYDDDKSANCRVRSHPRNGVTSDSLKIHIMLKYDILSWFFCLRLRRYLAMFGDFQPM